MAVVLTEPDFVCFDDGAVPMDAFRGRLDIVAVEVCAVLCCAVLCCAAVQCVECSAVQSPSSR